MAGGGAPRTPSLFPSCLAACLCNASPRDDNFWRYEEKRIKSNKFLTDYRVGDIFVPKLEMTEGLSNLVSDFASAIKSKKIPISNNKLSLMTVKILESAEKSLHNNGRLIKL